MIFLRAKEKKGITLIALVITIIVLLILAGVTIAAISGDNGILQNAGKAKEETDRATDIEKIKLAMSEAQIGENGYQELDQSNLQEAINKQFEERNAVATDNGDGSFTVNLDKKLYKIENNQLSEVQADLYINNADELKKFRDEVNNGNTFEGKYIVLTNDIQLSNDEEWSSIGIYDNESTNPDEEINKPFSGIFDGNFHKISGISINTTEKARGLFGLVKEGTIKNLGITNSNIIGSSSIGGIVGYTYNNSNIINCYNMATINITDRYAGGIVGFARTGTNIKNCYNAGNITSKYNAGGIVGAIINSSISNCYNIGNIATNSEDVISWCGGICSQTTNNSSIKNCYNIGYITTINDSVMVGGIVGNIAETDIVNNTFFLENTINDGNGVIKDGTEHKNADEMKQIYSILGPAFKKDNIFINQEYPILSWQS